VVNFQPRWFSLREHIEVWCACADLGLKVYGDPDVYVCGFERLVGEPEEESGRIFEFLGMGSGVVFEPRGTKEVGFREEERELILSRVKDRLEMLHQCNIHKCLQLDLWKK